VDSILKDVLKWKLAEESVRMSPVCL